MWHKGSGYQEQQQTRLKFLIKRLRCLLDSQALQRCFFQITFTQRPVLSSAAADMVTATWLGLYCTFHLCKRFPFFTFSHSEMSLSHCNVTLAQRQNGSVPLDWVFVISIPERRSSSSAWDVTLIYTFTFTDVTLVWHKGCGYQQTSSVPLDWVFVVPPGALVTVRTLKMKDHQQHSGPRLCHSEVFKIIITQNVVILTLIIISIIVVIVIVDIATSS